MTEEIKLNPFEELRFEVDNKELRIYIIEGNAEVLGQELINERWYLFKNVSVFVYSIFGCTMKIEGECKLKYVSKENNIKQILEFFESLKPEDKIAIMGNRRSELAITISNLYARIHRKVVMVEMAVETGILAFPGVVGGYSIDRIVEYNKGTEYSSSILYFYGDVVVNDEERLLKIASKIATKTKSHPVVMICPNEWELTKKLIETLNTTKLVVVGDERLFHLVNYEEKSYIGAGGLYEISQAIKIQQYFYGRNSELTPFSLNLRDQRIFARNEAILAPESALPLGEKRRIKAESLVEIEFPENYVVGIVDCSKEDEILTSPSIGFFICLEKENLRVLAPQSRLPKEKFLFKGEIKHFEG